MSGTSVTFHAGGWIALSGEPSTPPSNLAPTAPVSLSATATSSTVVSVTWGAATDPDGTVASYDVMVNGVIVQTVTGLTATVTGLAADVTYSIAVRATDNDGATGPNATTSVTTPSFGTGFPTLSTTGLAGVGVSVASLNNKGGVGWRGYDFYGAADGSIFTGYDIRNEGSLIEFPASDAGKTITFRRCRIYSGPDGGFYTYWGVLNENGVNLVFEDCDLIGGTDSAIAGSNYTLRRCRVHGGGDGLKFNSSVLIEDSYIDAYIDPENPDPHADGAQTLSTVGDTTVGSGATLRHNTIWMPPESTSCVILSTGSADQIRDVLIENNLMRGGVYSVYAGYQAGSDTLSKVSNIVVRDNAFSTTLYPYGGSSGPLTSVDAPAVSHTGNYWFDGPNAGEAID